MRACTRSLCDGVGPGTTWASHWDCSATRLRSWMPQQEHMQQPTRAREPPQRKPCARPGRGCASACSQESGQSARALEVNACAGRTGHDSRLADAAAHATTAQFDGSPSASRFRSVALHDTQHITAIDNILLSTIMVGKLLRRAGERKSEKSRKEVLNLRSVQIS